MATSVRVVHPTHCPDLGPICQVRDEPPQLHDQRFWVAELRASVEFQLLRWLGAELQLPLRLSATRIRYRRLDGALFTPDYPDIHHRDEALVGLADPAFFARLSAPAGSWLLVGRLGLTVPLGRTEPDPFALGAQGLPHQHVQFGTGTFNPLLGGEVAGPLGPLGVRAHGQVQLSLAQNRYGYRAGNRLQAGLEAAPVGWRRIVLAGTVDVYHEQPERWGGVIQQDGNLGRTDLLVGAAVTAAVGRSLLHVGLKVPVYQHVVSAGPEAGQLTYPALLSIGVRQTFDTRPSP